jgi:protein tyrosine phosphatase
MLAPSARLESTFRSPSPPASSEGPRTGRPFDFRRELWLTVVRYKNIWPYDFSRVRLETPTDDDSDYINASFVQPRGTSRRYIATQGPLDATYRDFWTLVWEQNVRVIVM